MTNLEEIKFNPSDYPTKEEILRYRIDLDKESDKLDKQRELNHSKLTINIYERKYNNKNI